MDQQQNQQLKKYLDLIRRWKAFIVACILLSLPIGLGVYLITPKVYQATSLLSYQQQKIGTNTMAPDMAAAIKDVVSTLTQIVTSRTNLENMITTLNLYPEAKKHLPMEDVVDFMVKDIAIEPSRDGDIFQIKYSGSKPDQVVKVTNALAANFIEENLKYREERASETSSYASNELEMAKTIMDQKEASMRDYKLKYYNELSEQQAANVTRLIALQEQYQGSQESIQEQERTLVMIQDQIANRRRLITSGAALPADNAGAGAPAGVQPSLSTAERLLQARALLQNMRIKYTENHPDVKRAKKLIAKLESDLAQGRMGEETVSAGGQPRPAVERRQNTADPIILQLEAQLKNISLNIQSIIKEKEQLKKAISQYERWVAAAPVREAEWSALTREYGELKRHYDFLVSSDLQAKSMLNLEKRQKGSQFKIVDSARLPEKPIRPDFVKILGLALLCGLGLGAAVPIAIGFFDSSFRDVNDLEAYLGVPVVCTVPFIETGKEKVWRKRKLLLGMLGCIFAILLILALFYSVWHRGLIVL